VRRTSVYAYYDVGHVWLKQPLSNTDRAWLNSQCGKLRTARQLRVKEPAWFNPSYKQTFRLFQPSQDALTWLGKRNDLLLTYVELALDFITDGWSKLALADAFNKHFVQRWHRSRESKIFDDFYGNGNTGPRRPGLRFQWYTDLPSKATGEVRCFHLEVKCQGSAALRRIGINHPRDLIPFDHGKFWRGQLTGALLQCDCERLGRYHANKRDGTKRRAPPRSKAFNRDAAIGNVLWRVWSAHEHRDKQGIISDVDQRSMQWFVDHYGRGPFLLCIPANNHHSNCAGVSTGTESVTQQHLAAYLRSLSDIEFCYPISPGGNQP
jgi:hypothetical protein